LSRELGINPKTVTKWRKRATVEDMKTGPTEPRSTVLTEAEEAMVVPVSAASVPAARWAVLPYSLA
jgi:transposase-like protein